MFIRNLLFIRKLLRAAAIWGLLAAMGLGVVGQSGLASEGSERVENFSLLDHTGQAHELYYYRDAAAIVIMVQGNGCPIVRNALVDIKAVREQYQAKNVRFLMLNANLQDDRASIAEEAAAFDIDFPILYDESQLIGESLGLERTAEVLLIDPQSWRIIYRGPINDRLDYERQATEASEHYLTDAIGRHLAGEPPATRQRRTKGCLIHFPAREQREAHRDISYVDDVAPILLERCAGCHRAGGIGPWAMSSYRMVQGFAPMMREVMLTGRMPPKHLDTEVSRVEVPHDLTAEEMQTLIHWIEAGAPRGEGEDPLADLPARQTDWMLGEPDLVLELPAFDVPATGLIDYQYFRVPLTVDRPRYVKAVEFMPGDRETVHHSVNRVGPGRDPRGGNHLVTYTPGIEPLVYDHDIGVLVRPGQQVRAQVHYTAIGRSTVDQSQIGLWFHDEEPEHEMAYHVMNGPLRIPPGVKAHQEQVYFTFLAPAVLYRLFPHAHYRGSTTEFRVLFPDGREQVLLSVPKYDFNWQFEYELEEPLELPVGSKVLYTAIYDNSPEKRGNPDPTVTVRQGLQSKHEMLYGGITFRYLSRKDNDTYKTIAYRNLNNAVGGYDDDLSGGLDEEEFDRVPKTNLLLEYAGFFLLDEDGDGQITLEEWWTHCWFKYLRPESCAALCV